MSSGSNGQPKKRVPSAVEKQIAASIVVAADKKLRKLTPQWIKDLADGVTPEQADRRNKWF